MAKQMMGGDAIGLPFKDWAYHEWMDLHEVTPPWMPKDYAQLASALRACGTEDVARIAWSAYLACTDDFYQGHPPGKFVSSLSRWVASAAKRVRPKKAAQVQGEAIVARQRIMNEVRADPAFVGDEQERIEYIRRVKELPE